MDNLKLEFAIANMSFLIEGRGSAMEDLRQQYRYFAAPTGRETGEAKILWKGKSCFINDKDEFIRAENPSQIPALTSVLIRRLLRGARPDLVYLQGSAMLDRETERAVLLVGDCGDGGPSLTKSLFREDMPRLMLLAEEDLIIDPARRVIIPFPRISSCLSAPGSILKKDRMGIGEGKLRLNQEGVSLSHAKLFLLSEDGWKEDKKGGVEWFWVGSASSELARNMRTVGLPILLTHYDEPFPAYVFERRLEDEEFQLAYSMLHDEGNLLLKVTQQGPKSREDRDSLRHHPLLEEKSFGDALPVLLRYLIRFGMEQEQLGQTAVALARAFSDCSICELKVGASVEEMTGLVRQSLEISA